MKRILITAGGTREPIDVVRFIGNSSTGLTGAYLAASLARRGYKVTLLRARSSARAKHDLVEERFFESVNDLKRMLRELLMAEKWDAVIHAAAVSDFSVKAVETERRKRRPNLRTKISSSQPLRLWLSPTPKLIKQIRRWALPRSRPLVVGFKLSSDFSSGRAELSRLFLGGSCHAVIVNTVQALASAHEHPFEVHSPLGLLTRGETKRDLARAIARLIIGGADASHVRCRQ